MRCLFRGLGQIINEDLEDLRALIAGLLKRWDMGKSVSRDSSRTKEGARGRMREREEGERQGGGQIFGGQPPEFPQPGFKCFLLGSFQFCTRYWNLMTLPMLAISTLWLTAAAAAAAAGAAAVSAVPNARDGAPPSSPAGPVIRPRPNFVLVLVDDLDLKLGGTGASTMERTRRLIGGEGTTFTNWFAQSPVCCNSRAEILTGKMFHNLRFPAVDSKSSYTEYTPTDAGTGGVVMFALLIGGSILLLMGGFFLVSDSNSIVLGEKLTMKANRWLDKASDQWLANARCRCGNFKGRDALFPTIMVATLVTLITVVGVVSILFGGQQGKAGHGCMHIDVADNASHPFYQRDYFAGYFQELNYTVGYFGKHLNR